MDNRDASDFPGPYAHSNPAYPHDLCHWEPLSGTDGHLQKVASHCGSFAARTFASPVWRTLAELTARWHDLGKFSNDFQAYLRTTAKAEGDAHISEVRRKVDHTSAGAQHAVAVMPAGIGALLAYPIAGHHAGLLDGLGTGACLKARLTKSVPEWKRKVPGKLLEPPAIGPLEIPATNSEERAFNLAFATRMLFSCLVDADFLATEAFMSPDQSAQRPAGRIDISRLDAYLNDHLRSRFGSAEGKVAEARARVLAACLAAAEDEPGLYSLTVPTGGGKTLSSLAFALRHAACNGLDRVIYAIPFTSIIEQNAETFREVFNSFDTDVDELILEHHSNFDSEVETTRSRLASENWDAPLIVTTNVQLFESLFANRTSRCRKLHRIAGSVIILDEVQTLPVTLLKPCLKVLHVLVQQYRCTVVLCTATQPAIEYRPHEFEIGLPQATPIIRDSAKLCEQLKRVEVKDAGHMGCTALAEQLAKSKQGLAIVNTRRHAADLYRELRDSVGPDGCFHLSAAMTPEHRSERFDEIRRRLKEGEPCRVVATQLIEAGVDVDFPIVWRSLAGLDSIAQAAGRCNREGRQSHAITWVFTPDDGEHPIPRGFLRRSADAASQVMASEQHDDLLSLPAIEHYFRLHYWQHSDQWDKQKIFDAFAIDPDPKASLPLLFCFARVAEKFRFIDDAQRPVIVPRTEQSRQHVERLRGSEASGNPAPLAAVRKLQRHSVSVAERHWKNALAEGHLELLYDRFAVLTTPQLHYDKELGLQLDADPLYDPNDTII